MRFESLVAASTVGVLGVSSVVAMSRRREEYLRRLAPGGTATLADSFGLELEYSLTGPEDPADSPLVVCENGLGSPLEAWDWLVQELHGKSQVLRYHRRGYFRSTTRLDPDQALEFLLNAVAPRRPLMFVSYSIGALVTANVLKDSPSIRSRTVAVYIVDGTDADLLRESRRSRESLARYRQTSLQEGLSALTGMNRWTAGKTEADFNYRASVQKSVLNGSTMPRTLITAHREFVRTPVNGQAEMPGHGIAIQVIAAGNNAGQQKVLANKLGATLSVVEGSNHRSILGKASFARSVASTILEDYVR
jgi:pimeloyl-ACP methyl ester carboxylesterase